MLSNIIIALSASVATLTLLDSFVSDSQKEALSYRVLSIWNWLDEMKHKTFVEWLKQPRAQIVYLVFAAAWFSIVVSRFVENTWIVMYSCFGLSTPVTIWIGRRLFARIAQADTRVAKNMIVNSMTSKVGLMGFVSLGALMLTEIAPYQWLRWIAVITLVATGAIAAFLCVLTSPFTTATILGVLLRISEFVVRRIAEYPKGPILALSVLLAGVGACLKIFG